MSEEKFVTKLDCVKVTNKILNKLNKIESDNGRVEEMLKGEFGMVNVVKSIKDDVAYIKKNGRLGSREKTAIYSAVIITVGTIIVALISYLGSLMGL